MDLRPCFQNRLACTIWVLYLFCLSRRCEISILKFFWNPEILLKFWDFWLIFCMWPLKILINKCYIATLGQKWLLPWFLRAGPLRSPHWSHSFPYLQPLASNHISVFILVNNMFDLHSDSFAQSVILYWNIFLFKI